MSNGQSERREMTGAEMVVQALKDNGVKHVFGYPGGAVLPIYDEIFQQDDVEHILVRHEQGAGHAAEGYARSTGKAGVMLVTSGPGATNAVTPLQDALMDSIPLVCLTGQVPTSLIGSDAFQECDTVGITRPCTKHNWLVKDVNELAATIHEAFHVATTGRPGPVVVDIPKDVQFAKGFYVPPQIAPRTSYQPKVQGDLEKIKAAVELMASAKKPIIYSGGGVINSGPEASHLLRELVDLTGFPITSTLMGLGAYPASGKNWVGMLGMHGTYEANMAMHDCDVMICIGARFDDRITGRLNAFSPNSKKIHIDIDPSSINKNVHTEVPIIGDVGRVLEDMVRLWRATAKADKKALYPWWEQIAKWRGRDSLAYKMNHDVIMPQYAIQRLYELTKDKDTYITTEVGQHQMWAAQHYHFEKPNRWMTSGGLGTMGYGLPAALGVQIAHPDALVIDIAGDASVQMTMQEMSAAVQYKAPIKIFILNNQYMGMVRQWQQLLHGNRLSHSYTEAMPDFVKLAEAYGGHGIRCEKPDELDDAIKEMISVRKPVLFDCRVANLANCFPMIPSGKAHNEMLLPDEATDEAVANAIDAKGRELV
ncbi:MULTISPECIES: acetolactate synthase 3 large subunit [Mesorhizobium]|uniref:Acetolactate synthase n=5 Tax=Mesorhizobium TaxID=68287 RepID=A0A3M9XIP2_9HYPH|nr:MULTISPECIES: acetolactate synthase 3 large subunit [Mesorhizobium]MBE1709155.1 acetolactate synthase 3 large subunit [Mesorhizobium japonicum]MBE1717249.1 acetolactate synthase 3 large subunit [Mesorhizobium japonicum]MUT23759.1 acetolactate synthase 3 large subunit [Mesorhizobium japonicum]MUT30730.1 acetolactate synthase 3 large subunit [Mesorhizobium japonicum]PBB13527.1 acetolactate synthase 3 large subunit [Mesorhizobium loti]